MTKVGEYVLAAALALPPEARAEIADRLLQSLEDVEQPQVDAEWVAEMERRIEDAESGKMGTIPAEEVFARIFARNQ